MCISILPSASRRKLNRSAVVAIGVDRHGVGRDNESRRRLSGDGKVHCPELSQMEALRQTIHGPPERKRHKRCCQGACAVHEQVAYGVGHGVLADKKPLEDLPVGANGDTQGEHRGPESERPALGHSASVEQEVEREADAEGREGVGELVVRDYLVEEAEREAYGPSQRRQREEYVEEGGTPVASQQVCERESNEDGDDQRGLWVAKDDQRGDQDA